jgi:hypothetical protein
MAQTKTIFGVEGGINVANIDFTPDDSEDFNPSFKNRTRGVGGVFVAWDSSGTTGTTRTRNLRPGRRSVAAARTPPFKQQDRIDHGRGHDVEHARALFEPRITPGFDHRLRFSPVMRHVSRARQPTGMFSRLWLVNTISDEPVGVATYSLTNPAT